MATSPVKRRVLGALNPNASSPRPQRIDGTKAALQPSHSAHGLAALPQLSVASTPGKRTIDSVQASPACGGDPEAKRARLTAEEGGGRTTQPQSNRKPRSPSPADDSIFDHSAADTSQATAITEPDAERHTAPAIPSLPSLAGSVPRRPAPRLTRQQAREKADILRLRLGLANYKVRTGQTDVPLERLQRRPIPGSRAPPVRQNSTLAPALGVREVAQARADIIGRFREVAQMNASAAQAQPQARRLLPRAPPPRLSAPVDDEDDDDDEPDALPRLPPLPQERAGAEGRRPTTPQRVRPPRDEAELSSSALRGGAASGLLSLSRS
ncbi:hypothetical protein B0T18DRAFT_394601 [Schizothecium vesticola]|uniref:Cyclin-dependent kinase n=1 Tax=Schizothecium vesticola TaxID=314040 RepID=A0AA40BQ11_9PEZI|nr:hypothetical protein B0T18DRAFT_394601 [Schizothecium vesticola]